MKLAIGTAQFGNNYGIANSIGKIDESEQKKILDCCKSQGISMLDTAIAYGDSEQCLGRYGVKKFDVITKIKIDNSVQDIKSFIEKNIKTSLYKLKLSSIYGLLLHNSNHLNNSKGEIIFRSLENLKSLGVIEKIGISIYSPDELELILQKFNFDIIQSPLNIFDKRMEKSGWLRKLKQRGIETHIRSIFLQGLLLLPKNKIPNEFNKWKNIFDKWYAYFDINADLNPLKVCLAYVKQINHIDKIIIGIDSVNQLREIIDFYNEKNEIIIPKLECNDESLLNPSKWTI